MRDIKYYEGRYFEDFKRDIKETQKNKTCMELEKSIKTFLGISSYLIREIEEGVLRFRDLSAFFDDVRHMNSTIHELTLFAFNIGQISRRELEFFNDYRECEVNKFYEAIDMLEMEYDRN